MARSGSFPQSWEQVMYVHRSALWVADLPPGQVLSPLLGRLVVILTLEVVNGVASQFTTYLHLFLFLYVG
jgi:hypothetical protein